MHSGQPGRETIVTGGSFRNFHVTPEPTSLDRLVSSTIMLMDLDLVGQLPHVFIIMEVCGN